MKKAFLLFTAFLILASSFAATTVLIPKLKADETYIPIGVNEKRISLQELSTISMGNLEKLTGKKMSLMDKLSFKIAQRTLRKSIKADGTIENKKIEKFFSKRHGETGFHLGGFALGFLLGLIGVLIAYLIRDDYKRNRVKWAWIGFGVWIILYLILLAAILASI